MKRTKLLFVLLAVTASITCAGCTERNQISEQGELVKNEAVGEPAAFFIGHKSLRFSKKMVR